MPNLMDATATQLADMLDGMAAFPHNTSGLSQLDEATLAFGDLSPELRQAQREFAAGPPDTHGVIARWTCRRCTDTVQVRRGVVYGSGTYRTCDEAAAFWASMVAGVHET